VAAELLKIRTARLPWALLAVAVGLTGLHSLLFDSNAGGTGHASIPSLATYSGQTQAVNIPGEVLLLASVVGIILASGEFRHKTATATYLATPSRSRVLVAKAAAAACLGLVFGVLGAAVATTIGLFFVTGTGHHLLLSAQTMGRFAAGGAIASAILAAAGVAVGTLIRSQIGAIITVFVWGFVIEQALGGLYSSVQRYLPFTAAASLAGSTLGNQRAALPFAGAILLLAAVAALIALIAAQTMLQSDIT
jgi:hypothetical protein